MTARLIIGDVRKALATLPDASVDLIVTSWPYLRLRSYLPPDHPDKTLEIGSEATPAEFIDTLLAVTGDFTRVLAPHGSIATELGDSFSGDNGAGGNEGLRDEPPRRSNRRDAALVAPPGRHSAGGGNGWPPAKSLACIPALYEVALAYGINPLAGTPSPAGRWLVRNYVVHARPNPPVGALGDKWRPACSFWSVATLSENRYFDVDAVRSERSPNTHARAAKGVAVRQRAGKSAARGGNWGSLPELTETGGAPPLDWSRDDDQYPDDAWHLSTHPYPGAHFATFSPALVEKFILSMAPHRVCRACGQPSRRIAEPTREYAAVKERVGSFKDHSTDATTGSTGSNRARDMGTMTSAERVTLGWTECGCGDGCRPTEWKLEVIEVPQGRTPGGEWVDMDEWASDDAPSKIRTKRKKKRVLVNAGECHDHSHWRNGIVLDPFAGSGTTLAVATGHGRDAIGIDIDERNAALALQRVGPLMLTVETLNTLKEIA